MIPAFLAAAAPVVAKITAGEVAKIITAAAPIIIAAINNSGNNKDKDKAEDNRKK